MALKSSTFVVRAGGVANADAEARKERLLGRHRGAIERVVADAKTFSEDRRRALDRISDKQLRDSASR
jgi:hypothetical protein